MIAKARCAEVYEMDDASPFCVSIVEDLLALNVQSQAAAPQQVLSPEPHPDAKLLDLGKEFERLLATELQLEKEKNRTDVAAERLRGERMGFDPEDPDARRAAGERFDEWRETWEAAATDVGYHEAWEAWNSASEMTARVGKKIFKIAPKTNAGLLVRLRVIETHDEIFDVEPAEKLLKEIRAFASGSATAA